MKHYLLLLPLVFFFISCQVNIIDDTIYKDTNELSTTFLVNDDPSDFTIAHIFTAEKDSIYIFGEKDSDGNPTHMRDVIISPNDAEGRTELMFDENDKPIKVISYNGVVMLFEWVDDTHAALTMIDPTSEEQLNTVISFDNQEISSTKAYVVSNNDIRRNGKTSLSISPLRQQSSPINLLTKASSSSTRSGSLSITQCNTPSNAECWVDAYSYSGMPNSGFGTHVGRLKATNVGQGKYEYSLPSGIVPSHHDLSEACDKIMPILTGICQTSNMLGPAYKNAICIQLSAMLASGIVSVGVALGFESACTALNYSLEIFCRSTAMQGLTYEVGTVNGGDGLCNVIKAMHLEWDDELLFVPTANALPSIISGTPCTWDGKSPSLPALSISWGGEPQITQFTLNPPAPSHGQSYIATADLFCLPSGTIVTLSIVGTDGYSDAQVYVVGDELNYSATLTVPGAESGVQDVCTVQLDLPNGSVKTKKASLVFQ